MPVRESKGPNRTARSDRTSRMGRKVSSNSGSERQFDQLYEIIQELKDWEWQVGYRPENYVLEYDRFRRGLLTVARDCGQNVRDAAACAVRVVEDPDALYAIASQVYLVMDRLGTNIDVLREQIPSQPGGSTHRGLLLAMQLRVQALCLFILMRYGGHFSLPVIERIEEYNRYFDTGPGSCDSLAEFRYEIGDLDLTLDRDQIRADLEQEIPEFERTIQQLSQLIESLANPVIIPENRRGVAMATPETEAERTPVSELGSENLRSGGMQSDFRADLGVCEEVAPAAASDQIGETTLAREGSDRASLDLESIVQRLTSLQEIDLLILIIASEHRIRRGDIHATLGRLRFRRSPDTISNKLTKLKHDLLLVRIRGGLWQTVAAVATYLNEGSDYPPNVSSALERFRNLRYSGGNETTQS